MTNEMIEKAKECKSAEELLALAKENGIEMTAEEAAEKFTALNNMGELSDDELENAAGGGCTIDGIARKDVFPEVGQVFTTRLLYQERQVACSKCGSIYFRCTSIDPSAGTMYSTCTNCGAVRESFYKKTVSEEHTIVYL